MDIKTFEAFSMKDAIKNVKKSLGADAVILSTREKASPDGKGKLIEVTAAAAGSMRSVGGATASSSQSTGISAHLESQVEGLAIRLAALQDATPSKRQVEALESGLQEMKLLLIETLRGKDGSSLKDLPPAIVPVERQLRAMGVDDTSLADLIKHLRTLPEPETGAQPDEHYRDHAIRWMLRRVKIAPKWTVSSGGTTAVHALVGPAGAGKTAAVAKLAALYHLKEKVKVTVASFDHSRIAAADQMRIFCKIVGVPFVTISDEHDLKRKIADARDADLFLVDTAGVSAKSASGVEALGALKAVGIPVEFHLCLSVTEKETQLDQAIKGFAPLGIQSLLFTRLDESWSFGEIYNVSRRWSLPLSFFSIGPEIPQDIERATRERIIERIFGL